MLLHAPIADLNRFILLLLFFANSVESFSSNSITGKVIESGSFLKIFISAFSEIVFIIYYIESSVKVNIPISLLLSPLLSLS